MFRYDYIILSFTFLGSTNATDCIDCPPGYYCEGTANVVPDGLCDEGFWCGGAASSARPYDPGNAVSIGGNARYIFHSNYHVL